MEVNVKNKQYNYVEKSIIKLNDISPSFIDISRKESKVINIYYIGHFYLDDNDIELKPFYFAINDLGIFMDMDMFMDILKKILVINILILIILTIIKRFCTKYAFMG